MTEIAQFPTEADLCRAFISQIPKQWTAYPESCGYDILLVRDSDGVQIGIEAKLRLNVDVIRQIVPRRSPWSIMRPAPDFRAVLVPWGRAGGLSEICGYLNITVIKMMSKELYKSTRPFHKKKFYPDLPSVNPHDWYYRDDEWYDWCPAERCRIPDYVPDVRAGSPSPIKLSEWKIKAIKLVIILERRGYVTRSDFEHLKLSISRWIYDSNWLSGGPNRGQYVRSAYTPDFRKVHPVNYAQIEADYDKWAPEPTPSVTGDLP